MCQSMSKWVSEWVSHLKRLESSTDRNPPPIFTKLATKVESREMWLPVVLVEIRKMHAHQIGSGINFHHCSYGKIALMSNISKTMGSVEVEYETTLDYRLALWPLTLDDLKLS